MFSTDSTEFSTNKRRAKRGIHILFHTAVEMTVEKNQYSLYIVEKSGHAMCKYRKEGCWTLLKGVNKKVIEINQPDSVYFERAVLYLRPEVTEVPLQAVQKEADGYLESEGRHRKQRLRSWVIYLLGLATTAAVWLVMELLIR